MMRALVFGNTLCYRTDYPIPQPKENEALVRVTCAGICNTDLEITKGYMGGSKASLAGSRCGPFAPAIRALEKICGRKHLISRIFPLEEGVEAFRYASEKGRLKVLLRS